METTITFKIESDTLTLDIAIADINSLHLHEMTIPEATEQLASRVKKDGCVRDPVIVDRDSFVVLDGMHRVTAAKTLGCIRMPVCLVDYDDPSICIDTWYRTFQGKSTIQFPVIVNRAGYSVSPTNIERAEDDVEKKKAVGFFADHALCALIERNSSPNIYESYQAISLIETEAKGEGMRIRYETAGDARAGLQSKRLDAIVGPRKISKADVRTYGIRNDPFPHKATRHLIPARPLMVNVTLELLQDSSLSLENLNQTLVNDLRRRTLTRISPGSVIHDRRYDEEVFVFQ